MSSPGSQKTPDAPQVRCRHAGRAATAIALVAGWAALTGLLIAVGVGVVHSPAVRAFDRHLTSVVVDHRTPALDGAMKAVTWLGSWVALVATGVLLVVLCLRRRLPAVALVLAVIAWAGENGGVTLAKHVVGRGRPPQELRLVQAHGWSWPSGHTAVAFLVFTVLALVAHALAPRSVLRSLVWIPAALAVLAVAFSRVELGVHWTTDVLASMVFVSGWLAVLLASFTIETRPVRMEAEPPVATVA